MKTPRLTVALALVLSPCAIGCVEQEAEAGPAAYPEAVGYTPPPSAPPPQAPQAPPPGEQAPQGQQAGDGTPQNPQQEVVIGGQEGDQYADTDPSALTDFRSTLDPYGSWVEDPTYGTAWVPSQSVVGEGFTPYVSAGHWAYDNDYVWVSDYDWGWAPFHYGRWVYGGAAWEWIPGRAYAGAWTSWRYGYGNWGYVGWAPLPPTWGWRGGCAVGLGFVPTAPYAFVGTQHLFSPALSPQLVTGGQVGLIAAHTQPWVPASPGVGTHSLAHPTVGGPPPSALNLQASAVAQASATDRGLAQARAFSRASTATPLGARPPAQAAARAASSGWGGGARVPSYAANRAPVSHFGGRLGTGFSGNVASAAPSRSYAASSRPYYGSAPSYGSHYSAPARSYSGYGGTSGYSGYHGGAASGGGYHVGGGSSEGFHGGGGGGSFHSSGGGGYSGGGGGFHGGGGGGHGGGHR